MMSGHQAALFNGIIYTIIMLTVLHLCIKSHTILIVICQILELLQGLSLKLEAHGSIDLTINLPPREQIITSEYILHP